MSEPVFTPAEERALASLLDELIPPSGDGRLPGAGELGLGAHVAAVARANPDVAAVLRDGLAALDARARERGGAGFAALPRPERTRVLQDLAATGPSFLPGLLFHTYVGYYQHPRVLEGLGLEPRPPHPAGYELEPGDLSLLDPVRRRGRLYREV